MRSWAALGAYVGGLGQLLGPILAVLRRSWGLCGRPGAEKCEEHAYLENVLISRAGARSAAWRAVLGRSWGLCWRSRVALGAYVGGLVRDLGLCWRSWAALATYVGGLGPLLEPMLAVLFAILASVGSGSAAVRRRDGPAGPEGRDGWDGRDGPDRSEAQSAFFL